VPEARCEEGALPGGWLARRVRGDLGKWQSEPAERRVSDKDPKRAQAGRVGNTTDARQVGSKTAPADKIGDLKGGTKDFEHCATAVHVGIFSFSRTAPRGTAGEV